jgi:OOP family OmpA-OmpF porin
MHLAAHRMIGVLCAFWHLPGSLMAAEDMADGKDHPLFGRYQGSSIAFSKVSEFDEQALLQAPHNYSALLDRDALRDRSGAEWLKAEGRVTLLRYDVPSGRSSLEVTKNYEQSLKSLGFRIIFSCVDQNCFVGHVNDPFLLGQQIDTGNGISTAYFDHARYMLVRLDRPEGAVYASVLTGEDKGTVTAFLAIVETKDIESGKITFIDAGAMQKAITETGNVSLYGIEFDYDKDVVRPGSKPTLDEIAKLMTAKPELHIEIVGHTDNSGTADYNMDLSRRRAASVVTALTRDYSIAPVRLTSRGAGLSSPVAPNDTDEGRAKNRRVELIAK